MPSKKRVNATTGEVTYYKLTAEEIEANDIRRAAAQIIIDQEEAAQAISDGAQTAFRDTYPEWFRWSPAEGAAYVQNNVNDLASAKLVLKILVYVVLAIADRVFPERRGQQPD